MVPFPPSAIANPGPRTDALLRQVEDLAEEMVDFAAAMVRLPTINPPGQAYRECAEVIGRQWEAWGHDVQYLEAAERPEHTATHPRVNVLGRLAGVRPGPCLHINGHFDVVPPGEGWTRDPFGGTVADGCLFGRGSADMKGGIAAAAAAVEAIRRAGIPLAGSVELSGTVDEETGGFAGVAHLAHAGILDSRHTDWVIIPEPFGPDRVCIGHRGVYWFRVVAHGHTAHGSMPYQGRSAIEDMAVLLERMRTELQPLLAGRRSALPVVPEASRVGTLNINSVLGGQAGEDLQSPCVAERCEAVLDRRFIPEEAFEEVRAQIVELIREVEADGARGPFALEDMLVVHPTRTPVPSALVDALQTAAVAATGGELALVASPGTYDHKHVARIAGVHDCVAYGPGRLEQAHQPDERVSIEDMVASAKVFALTAVELLGQRA